VSDEDIIRSWKMGATVEQVAKEYMRRQNKEAERKREPKIKILQAMEVVEPIIFRYETKDWKKRGKNEVQI